MRKILFRGKPKSELIDWIYGCYFWSELSGKHYIMGVSKDYGYTNIEVIPETVGQYTGLKDKNGKEIFEGDIVKGDIPELFPHYTGRTGKVEWGESAWIVDFSDRYPAYDLKKVGFCSFGNYEVIGNIHDTPELLEDSND